MVSSTISRRCPKGRRIAPTPGHGVVLGYRHAASWIEEMDENFVIPVHALIGAPVQGQIQLGRTPFEFIAQQTEHVSP